MSVVVFPTDTIYGLLGSALDPKVVERIYQLRKRNTNKPMIVLISSLDDLSLFDIKLTSEQKRLLSKLWPNPLSVVLPCPSDRLAYLHRGTQSLALRMPKDERLLQYLKQHGPQVAPSANIEGEAVAETVEEARGYFGDEVEYVDGGKITAQPSTLVSLNNVKLQILREGSLSPKDLEKLS